LGDELVFVVGKCVIRALASLMLPWSVGEVAVLRKKILDVEVEGLWGYSINV